MVYIKDSHTLNSLAQACLLGVQLQNKSEAAFCYFGHIVFLFDMFISLKSTKNARKKYNIYHTSN